MSTHKSSDYKLTAVKYFLENLLYKENYRKIINLKE